MSSTTGEAYYFDDRIGKYVADINGKRITRRHESHIKYALGQAGVVAQIHGQSATVKQLTEAIVKSEFPVAERFEFINKFVKLLAKGTINSFVLTGSGGIGKTTAVIKALEQMKLREDLPESNGGDYRVIRGFSTPRALYNTLYEFRNKVLVLDDADKCFTDTQSALLLKAALDDKKVRVIDWGSSVESDIPNRFTYNGRIVFISNMSVSQFPQAIVSRSQNVDLTLTVEEKVDIIRIVFKDIDKDENVKSDVLEFVEKNATKAKDLNIRSAVSLITLRESFGKDWERIAAYSFKKERA